MRLVLALPHLLSLDPAILAGMPGLARVAAAADAPAVVPDGLDAASARAAGAPADASLAQLAAIGAGFDPGTIPVLYADPVSLVPGRDDVLFRGHIHDLTDAEAHTLVALLNAHFAPDGIAFHAPRADTWFVTAQSAHTLATTPPARVRGPILPHLPQGDAARSWRRWMSEMQMLLHEHPINATREASELAPVTGVWVWGGGRQEWPAPLAEATWWAPAGRDGDVVRGLAQRARRAANAPPASFHMLGPAVQIHAVLPRAYDSADAHALDAAWLAPAAQALTHGDIESITLLADAGGAAWQWTARRPTWMRRLRQRFSATPFTLPGPDADA